jgi:hypothetical protein
MLHAGHGRGREAMKDFAGVRGCDLVWGESNGRFELRREGDLYATLVFRSSMGTLATAETAHGNWTFKRVGFLNPLVTAREIGSDKECALFRPRLCNGGQVTLSGGLTLGWKAMNFWQTQRGLLGPDGTRLLEFSPGANPSGCSGFFKTTATVSLGRDALTLEALALLAAMGFYLLYLSNQDTETATMVAITAGIM